MGHFEEITITCKEFAIGSVKWQNQWA